jgi:predicted RNase H-like HicB family nuclease
MPIGVCERLLESKEASAMNKYRIQVLIEQDEDGKYIASCPSLQGCYTQGDTIEEAMENIQDVIEMCLEELLEEQKEIKPFYPQIIDIKQIKVAL